MKNLFHNRITGCLLGAGLLFGLSACTDDHFDIQTGTVSGSKTLWQNIAETPQLDSLAMILSRAKVMKDETDKGQKQTYAELLDQPQELTVWAPKNGTYNARRYLDLLDQADALRLTDSVAAREIDFQVSNQFARNHIARFNYESVASRQQVRMMNSKLSYYDAAAGTFNNVPIDPQMANINASNGMLHVLDGVSPFAYNLYDYMENDSMFTKIYSVIYAHEKRIFNESSSTEGAMNDNGQMEYVDSVFTTSNEILDPSLASVSDEDSLYIAIIPTNNAWDGAYQTVSTLYRYGDSYNYEWQQSSNSFLYTGSDALRFNTDSLTELSTYSGIIQSMFISPATFSSIDRTDSAAVINYVLYADSLITTNNMILYNPLAGTGQPNPLFGGKAPVRASNGYIFAVDTYTYDPAYTFITRRELPAYYSNNLASVTGATTDYGTMIELNSDNRNPEVSGEVEDDYYQYFVVDGNNPLRINFRLDYVYSGHYKISVQMLPNRVNLGNITYDNEGNEEVEAPIFNAELFDDDGDRIGSAVNNISVPQDSISKIVIWDDIELEKSYNSLPSGYSSFPYLRLTMTYAQQRRGNCHALSIAKVILEPVRDEE